MKQTIKTHAFHYQLSIVNCQLSIINYQLSIKFLSICFKIVSKMKQKRNFAPQKRQKIEDKRL
jgi:hypothetical protein